MPLSRQVDHIEVAGTWWVPGRYDNRVHGNLRLTGDDFDLRLEGQLFAPDLTTGKVVSIQLEDKELPLIHGRTTEDEQVTLLASHGLIYPIPETPDSIGRELWNPQAALIGTHLAEPVRFDAVSVEYDILHSWVEPPSLIAERASDMEDTKLAPRSIVLDEASLPDARVEVTAWAVGSLGTSGIHLDRVTAVEFKLDEPLEWSDILQYHIRPLSDLLAFLTIHAVRLTAVTLAATALGEDATRPVSLHFPVVQAPYIPDQAPVSIERERMLSSRLRPLVPFQTLLPRWIDLHSKIGSGIAMLTLPQRSPFIYDENRFLSAFWGAESLHKLLCDPKQLSPEEHSTRVSAILDPARSAGASPEHLSWARNVLEGRNDKTLRERIDDLLDLSGEVGIRILAAEPKFVGNLTGTRGPLAHVGSGGKLKTPQRFYHAEALRWVLRACILSELGADKFRAEKLVVNHKQFRWILRGLAVEDAGR